MSIRRRIGGWEVENFSSTIDFVESTKDRQHQNIFSGNVREHISNPKWSGCKSYEEAINYFQNGWKSKTYKQTLKKMQTINSLTTKPSRQRFQDVAGFQPIVPNALRGLPQSMINERMIPKKSKVIDIVVSLTVNADVPSSAILKKLDEIILKVAEIEKQGFRANIIYYSGAGERESKGNMMTIKIKDAKQPININKIMFLLGHTSMLRILMFDWLERTEGLSGQGFGYGCAFDSIPDFLRYGGSEKKKDLLAKMIGIDPSTTYIISFNTDLEKEFSRLK